MAIYGNEDHAIDIMMVMTIIDYDNILIMIMGMLVIYDYNYGDDEE